MEIKMNKPTTEKMIKKSIHFDLPDRLVAKLKRIAKARGQTLKELICDTLSEVANG